MDTSDDALENHVKYVREVQSLSMLPTTHFEDSGMISCIKLLFDDSSYASEAKAELMEKLEDLKAAKQIEKYEHVVQDFFVLWFQHIKRYLQIHIMISHAQLVNLICQSAVANMVNHYRVLPKTLLPNSSTSCSTDACVQAPLQRSLDRLVPSFISVLLC
jgi:hypothetical protein